MKLSDAGILNRQDWEAQGFTLSKYDRSLMKEETKKHPEWVHFGAGNIFRAFHAAAAQKLLDEGLMRCGITVVEGFDTGITEKIYRPHDDLSILVTLKSDGTTQKTVVGSVGESLVLDLSDEKETSRLKEIFASPTLKMATFTITEKGYIVSDDVRDPQSVTNYMGKVAALLYHRFISGSHPIALVSTDNCSHNGERLKESILFFAQRWEVAGVSKKGFGDYVSDESRVSFPWTMIDKITPRPDESIQKMLEDSGVEDIGALITDKGTYIAPFVNAEESGYMVIEDSFPAGRPPLEKAGFIFADRDTVDGVEQMKVCTCLNPLHTALAVFGCLLGYTKISDEMKDDTLRRLVERIGYDEGLCVVTDPKVIAPSEFIDTVLNVRLPNPFMPDSPQRIATDTSQKIPIRFGETVKRYISSGRSTDDLRMIPLVFAGWIRYLMAVDDNGRSFEPSSDPRLEELQSMIAGIKLGDGRDALPLIEPILHDATVFGTDLYLAGLSDITCRYFIELIEGKGAVRNTLEKYVHRPS